MGLIKYINKLDNINDVLKQIRQIRQIRQIKVDQMDWVDQAPPTPNLVFCKIHNEVCLSSFISILYISLRTQAMIKSQSHRALLQIRTASGQRRRVSVFQQPNTRRQSKRLDLSLYSSHKLSNSIISKKYKIKR